MDLKLPPHVLQVSYEPDGHIFVAHEGNLRRRAVTSCRDALNGYQKGCCFYCSRACLIGEIDVDHFLPRALQTRGVAANLDGVWNLVLACVDCNRGVDGKFIGVPALQFLGRLHRRNEFFIGSHHPLCETLQAQSGETEGERRVFLNARWREARDLLPLWVPPQREEPQL
jgi:hypothetical protein